MRRCGKRGSAWNTREHSWATASWSTRRSWRRQATQLLGERRRGLVVAMAKPPAQLGAWDAQEEMDETGVVKQRRRLLPTVTECYFQGTVQYFDGISRGRCLSMVFCGSRSLSMLPNQFSLIFMLVCAFNDHMSWLCDGRYFSNFLTSLDVKDLRLTSLSGFRVIAQFSDQ